MRSTARWFRSTPPIPQFGQAPRSLVGPTCSLPTALSGDPWLPQIRATSGELGARGRLLGWEWNFSAYRTDLRDDLYFVGVGDGRSYFDTIGKTRRQGLELGFKGKAGPAEVKVNYAYVDATFRSRFYMISPHNSSADFDQNSRSVYSDPTLLGGFQLLPSPTAGENRGFGTYRMIRVDPGARMPGIPQHNFNTTLAGNPTAGTTVGLTMIARSYSYVRGNENNAHQGAGTDQETGQYLCNVGSCGFGYVQLPVSPGRPFTTSGRVGGYAIFQSRCAMASGRRVGARTPGEQPLQPPLRHRRTHGRQSVLAVAGRCDRIQRLELQRRGMAEHDLRRSGCAARHLPVGEL